MTPADVAALEEHYQFVPEQGGAAESWQERMVQRYHAHLYKDYVLADLTRSPQKQIGLRWRTRPEVESGRGSRTCGNKHCPSSQQSPATREEREAAEAVCCEKELERESVERRKLKALAHGVWLSDYEVPFTYEEAGESKTELVKLKLCARCAPLLFESQGKKRPHRAARKAWLRATKQRTEESGEAASTNDSNEADKPTAKRPGGSESNDGPETKRAKP